MPDIVATFERRSGERRTTVVTVTQRPVRAYRAVVISPEQRGTRDLVPHERAAISIRSASPFLISSWMDWTLLANNNTPDAYRPIAADVLSRCTHERDIHPGRRRYRVCARRHAATTPPCPTTCAFPHLHRAFPCTLPVCAVPPLVCAEPPLP